jgi:hypothetical protein
MFLIRTAVRILLVLGVLLTMSACWPPAGEWHSPEKTWTVCDYKASTAGRHMPLGGRFKFTRLSTGQYKLEPVPVPGIVWEPGWNEAVFDLLPDPKKNRQYRLHPDSWWASDKNACARDQKAFFLEPKTFKPSNKTLRLTAKACLPAKNQDGTCAPKNEHMIVAYFRPPRETESHLSVTLCSPSPQEWDDKTQSCKLDPGTLDPHPGHVHSDD